MKNGIVDEFLKNVFYRAKSNDDNEWRKQIYQREKGDITNRVDNRR